MLGGVADYFLVERVPGARWDYALGRREQPGWAEHAAFMDALVEDGFVVLGGPVGEGEGGPVVLVVAARDEGDVRSRLAKDPWKTDMLTIASIRPWRVWLRGAERATRPASAG
jgi:hypothetical protein